MKRICLILVTAATASAAFASLLIAPGRADDPASPIFGVKIPVGYRELSLIGVSHLVRFDELRGTVGNAAAVKAYREGILPFPEGALLVKLAWKHAPLVGAESPAPRRRFK